MKRFLLFLFILNLYLADGNAQHNPQDTASVLALDQVLEIVREFHPIVQQASLQPAFAAAELRAAKGSLDPKIEAGIDQKRLNGTQYYQQFNGALKVPLWFPIDPKIGVYNNQGNYLNPENYISDKTQNWQITTGISLPLGKGLFIDERRSMIRQAGLYGNLVEAEQSKEINKVLLNVIKSYWEWYFEYQNFQLMNQSMEIAEELFRRTKLDFEYGEVAVVDTVQALIILQNRTVDYEKAKLGLTQSSLALSVHLWGPDGLPMELEDGAIPSEAVEFGLVPADSSIHRLLDWSLRNHPEIQKLDAKKQQLEIEKKWNQESLKPEVNLSYSLIDAPIYYEGTSSPDWNDSYKLGVDFAFPLYLRKERGKLQKTNLNIESLDFSLSQKQQEISAEIRSTFAELKTSEILTRQYSAMAENYEKLFQAEIFNLENGESDLFKLNIQQDKYLESNRKYYEARLKLQKLKATLPYVVGLPNLSYQSLYE